MDSVHTLKLLKDWPHRFDLPPGLPCEELDRVFCHEEVRNKDCAIHAYAHGVPRRYFLFLLINVVFIFLVASTYWQLVRDLASSPAKGLEKLAQALNAGNARHFFVSYVILQGESALSRQYDGSLRLCSGFGLMPLQLLNLGIIIPRLFFRIFITRTPRGE